VSVIEVGAFLNQGRNTSATTLTTTPTTTQTTLFTESKTTNTSITVSTSCCQDANLTMFTPCDGLNATYPSIVRLNHLIETNPSFIAAESGNTFVNEGLLACNKAFNNGQVNGSTVTLYYSYATNRTYSDNCGDVGNITYYLDADIRLTPSGYDMSSLTIVPSNSSQITNSCTSPSTFSTTTISEASQSS
jgi:hypothetical protein